MVRVPPSALGLSLVFVATLVGLIGCTPAVPPASETPLPPIHEYVPSDWDLDRRQEQLAELAGATDLTDPPAVTIVRWVNPEEASGLIVECLQAAGFPAKLESNGYSYEAASDQGEAFALAHYVCSAQYPVRLDIDRPLNEQELDAVYRHLVDVFLPCAAQQGHTGLSVPSREVYASAMRGETLDPVYVQLTQEHNLPDDELESLLEECQLRPSGLRSHET